MHSNSERGWRAALYNHPILLISGLFLTGLLLVVLGNNYAEDREARSFAAFTERLMQTFVEQQQRELEKLVRDYAVWDDFFNHAHDDSFDQEWLDRNITDSLYRNFAVADALVVATDQRVVHALNRGESVTLDTLAEWNHEFAEIWRRQLRLRPATTSFSGMIRTQSGVQLLVAERIRLENAPDLPSQKHAWLVFARHLDTVWFEDTARMLSIADVKVQTVPPAKGVAHFTLLGLDKAPVGWLSWQVKRVNAEGARLYPLLGGLTAMFLFVVLLARSALQMHKWQLKVHARLLQQSETLRHLSHSPYAGEDEAAYLNELAAAVRKCLAVGRVSIWRNDAAKGYFRCVAANGEAPVPDISLQAWEHAEYFRLLGERRTLIVNEVEKSTLPALHDFWKSRGVVAVLDASVMVRGRLSGLLCIEVFDRPVAWEADQISFAESAADLIALAFVSAERRRTEAALHRQQFYDVLTGLPNQVRLSQLLSQMLQVADSRLVYSLWSVGGLRHVNEDMGRAGGDLVLQEIARRFELIPGETIVARLGSNRFVLVLRNVAAPDVSHELEHIYYRLRLPVVIDGQQITPQLSCGVSLAPQDALTAEELLRHAEFALESARSRNDSPIEFYAAEPNAVAREHYQLAGAMPAALLRGEFELHFQPFVDLNTRHILGAETLLRWHHPEKGMVSPLQFIPIAEETGQIHALGRFVLQGACQSLRAWMDRVGRPLLIAVNVSALQLRDPDFPAFVEQTLRAHALEPQSLELEITESLSIELFEQAPEALERLRAMGVRLSIDDFGTGYSSLSYLRNMAVHKLKIDRSFIEHVPDDRLDADLARMIISLGQILNMTVVGEGIETEAQLQFLLEQGCQIGQGYLFSRPLSAAAFEALLLNALELSENS